MRKLRNQNEPPFPFIWSLQPRYTNPELHPDKFRPKLVVTEKLPNIYSFFQGEEPAHGDQLLHNVAGGGRLPRRPRRHAILRRIRGHGPGA